MTRNSNTYAQETYQRSLEFLTSKYCKKMLLSIGMEHLDLTTLLQTSTCTSLVLRVTGTNSPSIAVQPTFTSLTIMSAT